MLTVNDMQHHGWFVEYIPGVFDGKYVEKWLMHYRQFHDMPQKTKEGVALLSMCADAELMDGVGIRVSRSAYWLFDSPALLAEYEGGKHVKAKQDELQKP